MCFSVMLNSKFLFICELCLLSYPCNYVRFAREQLILANLEL